MTPAQSFLRPKSAEPGQAPAAQREIAQAEEDYRRLRQAYLALATPKPNEVALAMVGADMDRAHAALQELIGLRPLPFAHEPSRVLQRQARRVEEENA
jgi:hypothetical protein